MKTYTLKSKTVTKTTKIVQISDSHIIVTDPNDGDMYKKEKERKVFFERESLLRTGEVHYATQKLEEAVDYAKSADLTVFTGDIVEFPTKSNVDAMVKEFNKLPAYLYTFGNHDYKNWLCSDSGEVQKKNNYALFQSRIKNDIDFAVKEINGVNVAVADNSSVQFSKTQYEKLKDLFSKPQDVILCFHIPLYTPDIDVISLRKVQCVNESCGNTSDRLYAAYPSETTKQVIDLIKENSDKILALLTGHCHFDAVMPYYKDLVQYICLPTYLNDFNEFIIEKK